jgi:hypothetical protein
MQGLVKSKKFEIWIQVQIIDKFIKLELPKKPQNF